MSLFENFMESAIFKCVNPFVGCTKLLHHTEVLKHEKECNGINLMCPACEDCSSVPMFALQKHVMSAHHSHQIAIPKFRINLAVSKDNANYYFFRQGDYLFFLLFYLNAVDKKLSLTALHMGDKLISKDIIQKVSLLTNNNTLIYSTERKSCCIFSNIYDKFQGFHIDISNIIPTSDIVVNFEIDTNNITTNPKAVYPSLTLSYLGRNNETDQKSELTLNTIFRFKPTCSSPNIFREPTTLDDSRDTNISNIVDFFVGNADAFPQTTYEYPSEQFLESLCYPTIPIEGPTFLASTLPGGYPCKLCGLVCKSGAGLASHMRAHERQGEGRNSSNDGSERSNPLFIPNVSEKYTCSVCGLVCQSGAGLASHMRAHKRRGEGSNTSSVGSERHNPPSIPNVSAKYSCSVCGLVCQSAAGLASHMRAHKRRGDGSDTSSVGSERHNPPSIPNVSAKYSCSVCGLVCQSGAGLASHMRAHERRGEGSNSSSVGSAKHNSPLIPNVSEKYPCTVCGQVCKSGAGLASHMRAHERKDEIQFSSRIATLSNVDVPTGNSLFSGGLQSYSSKPTSYSSGSSGGYSCDVCGRSCASGAGLASHMRAHGRRGES